MIDKNLSTPLISVLMSAHNNQDTLEECLKSVCKQTYTNWELIICNDASTDDSLAILKSFSCKDHRIKFFNNEKNLGLAASLNKCINEAKGKYIVRLDADDQSLPDRFKTQVKFLEEHTELSMVGSSMFVKNDSGIVGVRRNTNKLTAQSFLKGSPFFHPTIMIRKDVLLSLGGYNTNVSRAEDLDLWFRFYKKGFKGANLGKPLYIYHENTEDLKKRTLKSAFITSKVFYKGYKSIGIPWFKRWIAIKPIISSLIPNKLLAYYHRIKLN